MIYKTKNHFLLTIAQCCVNFDEDAEFDRTELLSGMEEVEAIKTFYSVNYPDDILPENSSDFDEDEAWDAWGEIEDKVWEDVNGLLEALINKEL